MIMKRSITAPIRAEIAINQYAIQPPTNSIDASDVVNAMTHAHMLHSPKIINAS